MRVLDLKRLCFDDLRKDIIQQINGVKNYSGLNLLNYKDLAIELDAFYDKILTTIDHEYVNFAIEFIDDDMQYSEQLSFAQYAINILISKLTLNTKRDRESRLNIPKTLDKLPNISRINLLKAINYDTRVVGFCGCISINGEKFDLLGSC